MSEESDFRASCQSQLDGCRKQLKEIMVKSAMLKKSIRESETDSSESLRSAQAEMEQLQQMQDRLAECRRQMGVGVARQLRKEGKRQVRIEANWEEARQQLADAKNEMEILMKEIRRLDFMVYGRCGQFQLGPGRNRKAPM
jgi:chromosome segregation ATPase